MVRAPRRVIAAVVACAIVAGVFGLQAPRLLGPRLERLRRSGRRERTRRGGDRAQLGPVGVTAGARARARPDAAAARAGRAAIRSEPAFPALAPTTRSRDGRSAVVSAYARAGISENAWREAAQRVTRRLAGIKNVAVGGSALATVQVNHQVQHDLTHAEELAFPILFVLALVVFRSVVAALLPLLCGALTILGALLSCGCSISSRRSRPTR